MGARPRYVVLVKERPSRLAAASRQDCPARAAPSGGAARSGANGAGSPTPVGPDAAIGTSRSATGLASGLLPLAATLVDGPERPHPWSGWDTARRRSAGACADPRRQDE